MSTIIDMSPSSDRKGGIVDDFAYSSNVAGASVYIRMGMFSTFEVLGIYSSERLNEKGLHDFLECATIWQYYI